MARGPLTKLRTLCLALPETTERQSHGEPAWFVRGKKLFATYAAHHHDDRLAFWCAAPEGVQLELVASEPARFFIPPYVGHRGWLGVYLDVPTDWDEIAELVTEAYRLVAPKRLHEKLWSRQPAGTMTGPSQESSGAKAPNEGRGNTKAGHPGKDARSRLTEICHQLPEFNSERQRQHIAFLVRNRRFAYYLEDHHGDGRLALVCKVGPGENAELIGADPVRFFMPSYVGPRGWVGMWLDLPEVDWDEARELVFESYRLVAPKRLWSQL